jgi:antitoxin component YwqK of YwqJK toxin-antitoxin module
MHDPKDKSNIWIERFYHKDGWMEKEISYESYKDGMIGYIIIFRENGSRESMETFYYDEDVRTVDAFDENNVLLTSHAYNYKSGKLVYIEEYYPSGVRSKSTEYTVAGVVSDIWTYADAAMLTIVTSHYMRWQENDIVFEELDVYENEVRVSAEMTIRTTRGEFVEHYINMYMPNGEMIKTIHYDEDGNIYDVAEHHK